jgi:hypothetical protein
VNSFGPTIQVLSVKRMQVNSLFCEHGFPDTAAGLRLEAEGLPFDCRPRESFVGNLSLAEAIRTGRQRALDSASTG